MTPAVALTEAGPGIVQITMQDRQNKNTFSPELMDGLVDAFRHIGQNPAYRVAVLTGYDTYFASGGTKEGLHSIQQGQSKFSDLNLYSLALDCPIPVISAMQGHGIGGGFVFGLFADFVVLSRESIYTTNFMKYGFTPGMGATYIVPRKLGIALGQEMLMSARTYHGENLAGRGIPFPVLPRAHVLSYSLDLARDLAEKPRGALVVLKDHLVGSMRSELPAIIERELAMHEVTFGQPEVRERIDRLFGN